jgi:hypothetical protein
MDRVQRNGGTAGLITAILLAALFVVFISSGLDPQTATDPTKALPLIAQKRAVFAAIGVLGALAGGFGLVFTVGLFSRLWDKAPTRAAAVLGLALVGLTGHSLGSLLLWRGGRFLAAISSTGDPVAANHAWIALTAMFRALDGLGSAFTGASILIAGWAILVTGTLSSSLGWVGVIGGVVMLLQLFTAAPIFMLVGLVLAIVWLAWAGSQLRRTVA